MPTRANNTPSVTAQVIPAADLAVTIIPSDSSANPDSDLDYLVEVTNNGPSEATDVVLLDTLPAGMTYVSALSPQGCARDLRQWRRLAPDRLSGCRRDGDDDHRDDSGRTPGIDARRLRLGVGPTDRSQLSQ